LDYCKGCGICASVCPKGAIQMVLEEGKIWRRHHSVGLAGGSIGISNSKRLEPEP
jgi:ferredoxin